MTALGWPGTYRLEVTPDLLLFVEQSFVEPTPTAEREAVRTEALHELHGSELVIAAEGIVVSRSHGQELMRAEVPVSAFSAASFVFEKATGLRVELELRDPDTLVARQAGKPPMTFRRALG